jgi:hypothetical protein
LFTLRFLPSPTIKKDCKNKNKKCKKLPPFFIPSAASEKNVKRRRAKPTCLFCNLCLDITISTINVKNGRKKEQKIGSKITLLNCIFYASVLQSELPDLSRNNIPNEHKIYQNGHKLDQTDL